jgi:hypothetical protein
MAIKKQDDAADFVHAEEVKNNHAIEHKESSRDEVEKQAAALDPLEALGDPDWRAKEKRSFWVGVRLSMTDYKTYLFVRVSTPAFPRPFPFHFGKQY